MSEAEQKPVEQTPAAEPAPAAETPAEPAAAATESTEAAKPAEEAKPEAAAASDKPAETTDPAPAKKEKVDEDKVKVTAEPITHGALGYKAPGNLISKFKPLNRYFWLGDEAVSTQSLSQYLRGEKPDVAHPTAAWSSQTGKGLLYFAKHADQKATPAGVLNLSEASDFSTKGIKDFSFKLHGQDHVFETKTEPERDGWTVSLKKAIEEAKAAREGIINSEGYKEEVSKLGKPTALAAGAAGAAKAEGSTPKKSTDLKPSEESKKATTDDEDEGKATKGKSRSVSRGKRASIFGAFNKKKEEVQEKVEQKKEEKAEAKEEKKEEKAEDKKEPEGETAAEASKPAETTAEEVKPAEAAAAVDGATDKKEEAATPKAEKASKRGSIFGDFFQKVKSPVAEKKESDVAPPAPPKDTPAAPAEGEAAKAEEPKPETTEAPKAEEAKPAETKDTATSPTKEKKGFFGNFKKSVDKVRSPSGETPKDKTEKPKDEAPKLDNPVPEPTPAESSEAAPATEAAKEEAPAVPAKDDAPVNGTAKKEEAAPAPEKKETRRTSFFGNKKKEGEASEGEGEKKGFKLGGLLRNPSKAIRGNKEAKKDTSTPAKVEEKDESAPAEEKKAEPEATTNGTKEEAKPAEVPNAIGDVVPDAVSAGQKESVPAVSAAA